MEIKQIISSYSTFFSLSSVVLNKG